MNMHWGLSMLIRRGFSFRLYPTDDQQAMLRRWIGTAGTIYNAALEQRSNHWRSFRRAHGNSISFASQCRELTALRAEFEWVADCPVTIRQQALRDLNRACGNFFKGIARHTATGADH
jgi:putative transposase